MRVRNRLLMIVLAAGAAAAMTVACSSSPAGSSSTPPGGPATAAAQDIGGKEEFGPYEPVANFPQPLEDDYVWRNDQKRFCKIVTRFGHSVEKLPRDDQ